MCKCLRGQFTLVIPYPQVTEQTLSAKGVVGLASIYFMMVLVISPQELKMFYFKNIVFFYGAPSWHLEGTMV